MTIMQYASKMKLNYARVLIENGYPATSAA